MGLFHYLLHLSLITLHFLFYIVSFPLWPCSSSLCPLSVLFPSLHVLLTRKQIGDSAAFFPHFSLHPPCLYCLNIVYIFRLTCIVYCLVLYSHVRPCCVSTLVCTCVSQRQIYCSYCTERPRLWFFVWMKTLNERFSQVWQSVLLAGSIVRPDCFLSHKTWKKNREIASQRRFGCLVLSSTKNLSLI